jgi:hypothetical protein
MEKKKKTVKAKNEKAKKGDRLECGVCGASVIVDNECSCGDDCGVSCCGESMRLC